MKDDSENFSKARSYRLVRLTFIRCLRKSQGSTKVVRKSYQEYSSDMHWFRGESGKETFCLQTLRTREKKTRQKSTLEDSMQKTYLRRMNISYSQLQMEQQNCVEETVKSESPL